MSAHRMASLTYAEEFVSAPEVIEQAAREGTGLGADPLLPSVGAALRLLAAACGARHVVEVAGSAGVSGLWLLAGMTPDGVLTSIQPEHQHAARRAYAAAGIPPQRTRVIGGNASEVLPRLTDDAYDLVLIDAEPISGQVYVEQALRLLRPGGVLAVHHALGSDRVADPAARDHGTVAMRELARAMRGDDRLVPALLPVGDGLLAAVLR